MDFANRGSRPMQQQNAAPQQNMPSMSQHSGSDMPEKPSRMKDSKFVKLSSVFVLFGVALLAAVMIIGLVFGGKSTKELSEAKVIDTNKYQAVFLNSQDGQVYFGKLALYNSDMYVLTDIYYVRVEQKVQPEGSATTSQQNISLAKLGNELHGPEDYMYIARDKVLFWENLKDDGQVVKAITEYKKNGSTDTTQSNSNSNNTSNTTDTTNP